MVQMLLHGRYEVGNSLKMLGFSVTLLPSIYDSYNAMVSIPASNKYETYITTTFERTDELQSGRVSDSLF